MAQEIIEKTKLQIFGKPVNIKRAKEPSEYIWENMGITEEKQKISFYFVMAFLAVILFFAYKV
jgi:hypothetical protein